MMSQGKVYLEFGVSVQALCPEITLLLWGSPTPLGIKAPSPVGWGGGQSHWLLSPDVLHAHRLIGNPAIQGMLISLAKI